MRVQLIILFLITGLLNVTGKVHAQRVNLNVKEASLERVFDQIKRQTGMGFWYDVEDLTTAKKVSIIISNASINEALNLVLKDQPLSYEIVDETVVITRLPVSRKIDPIRNTITGHVTDKNGRALPGVTVRIKGTSKGTVTDAMGNYSIEADPEGTIVFTFVGYRTFEILIKGQTRIDMTMTENEEVLNETVIKGYYNTTKELNTGNVKTITKSEIQRQPVGNALASMYARIPGLVITQTSGLPGSEFRVRIRGRNSLANGNDPLYIIDGVPFSSTSMSTTSYATALGNQSPFNNLNVNDIESITVLKDADATAIYGSMGANGVILISTNRGIQGASRVTANFYSGIGNVTRTLDLMNTEEYLAMRKEALNNENTTPQQYDSDLTVWDQNRYTDWQKVFIGGSSHVYNAQVGISGGTALTQYNLQGGYRKETTVFPGDYFDRQVSVQMGLNHKSASERLQLSFSGSFNKGNNSMPESDLFRYITIAPNTPELILPNGKLNPEGFSFLADNPFGQLRIVSRSITDNLLGDASITYKILPALKLTVAMGGNIRQMDQNILTPSTSYIAPDDVNPLGRQNKFMDNQLNSWIVEPQLSFNKAVGQGKIEALLGTTFRESMQTILTQSATGFSSDALIENIRSATNLTAILDKDTKYKYNAVFARIGYSYDNKYVINLTGRRDGSSRFGMNRQFGNFGAIGAGWIFSKEKLFNKSEILSFGKLRLSYGITGNDQLTDYQYFSTYQSQNYAYGGINGLVPSRLDNPGFSWESVKKLEAAVELGFLDGKIQSTISFYQNHTGNQLVGYPLSYLTGFNTIQANLPAKLQNSGLEIDLSAALVNSSKISWNVSANISLPKSKLLAFPNLEAHPSFSQLYKVGLPLNTSYRFHYLGTDKQTGLYTFEDIDGDGSVTYDDRYFYKPRNEFFGGVSSDLRYKDFEFSLLFQFVRQEASQFLYNNAPGQFNYNQPKGMLNHWQKPGDDGIRYVVFPPAEYEMFQLSDGVLSDASFIRLKNISISYSLPEKFSKKLGISNLKVYAQCQNLFTITNYKGLDPENGGSGLSLPTLRMLTAGINLSF